MTGTLNELKNEKLRSSSASWRDAPDAAFRTTSVAAVWAWNELQQRQSERRYRIWRVMIMICARDKYPRKHSFLR